jgi:hypothetical protein
MKYVVRGITWGCTFLSVICMIGVWQNGAQWFLNSPKSYPMQGFASMLVGIGWILPTMVYESKKLSRPIQILIHMTVGFTVYFPVAFYMGWIPLEGGTPQILLEVLLALLISLAIWFCFYLYYRKEARDMNRKLHQINR